MMGVLRRSLQSLCGNITTDAANTTTAANGTNLSSVITRAPPPYMFSAKDSNASFICTPTNGREKMSEESSLDALFYIVVVLLFYAFSIVVLMIKYIRRENREAYLRQYFEEFVTREKFESAKIRNQLHVLQMKTVIQMNPRVRSLIESQGQTRQNYGGGEQRPKGVMDAIPETICEEDSDLEEVHTIVDSTPETSCEEQETQAEIDAIPEQNCEEDTRCAKAIEPTAANVGSKDFCALGSELEETQTLVDSISETIHAEDCDIEDRQTIFSVELNIPETMRVENSDQMSTSVGVFTPEKPLPSRETHV